MTPSQVDPLPRATPELPTPQGLDLRSLYALAACLVVAATSWFLLKELGPLMRPIILAVFLAYLIVPIDQWLRRRVPAIASAALIVGATLVLVWGLAVLVYGNIVELNAEMPRLLDPRETSPSRYGSSVALTCREHCSRQARVPTKPNHFLEFGPRDPCAISSRAAQAFWPRLSSSAFT